jgi:ascorbate-specific PTS system EIIC-type component UlaA
LDSFCDKVVKKSLPKVLDFLKDGSLFLVIFLTLFLLLMILIVRYSGSFVEYQQVLRAPDRFWRSVVMVYCAFGMISFVLFGLCSGWRDPDPSIAAL